MLKRALFILVVLAFCAAVLSAESDGPPDGSNVSVVTPSGPEGAEIQPMSSRSGGILQSWNEGKTSQAWSEVKKWKSSDKKSPEPWLLAAQFYFEEKKYKKCLSMAGKALEKSPQLAEAFYWRGRAHEAMGNWLEAGNEFNAALFAEKQYQPAREALEKLKTHLVDNSDSGAAVPSD